MASKLSNDSTDEKNTKKRISTSVLQSITNLVLQCARQAIIVSKKLKNSSPGSPKKLISSLSNKATKLRNGKKKAGDKEEDCVWQRDILMGDKCQPLVFPGVMYYDKHGNLLDELPMRTPLASPLPGYLFTPKRS